VQRLGRWIGREAPAVATLSEIADCEALGERPVRLLAPLAFVSPVVMAVIADGNAPAFRVRGAKSVAAVRL
jgi:hypothetical protein